MADTEATLAERNGTHGDFSRGASIAQQLKNVFYSSKGREAFSAVQREAMDQILSKVSRISVGNHDHADSWHDIGGYSTLVVRDLEDRPQVAEPPSNPGRIDREAVRS